VRTGRQRLAKFNHRAGPPHSRTFGVRRENAIASIAEELGRMAAFFLVATPLSDRP
jgi:hypothetical protein